mmetsp:Transcript_35467/g.67950  ORF Transcript_35467/g.67950 Transcript_35467/m.67950 type:complete len:219 (-) Transcript_35467:382-1038(-)
MPTDGTATRDWPSLIRPDLSGASTDASHRMGPSPGVGTSSTRVSVRAWVLSPPPEMYQHPSMSAPACPLRPLGRAPSLSGTLHACVRVSSMCSPPRHLVREPPPNTSKYRSAMATAACPHRGCGGVPVSAAWATHSIVTRSSVCTSFSRRRSLVSPPNTHSFEPMRVVVWPPRATGAAPLGCSLVQHNVSRSMANASTTARLPALTLLWPPTRTRRPS